MTAPFALSPGEEERLVAAATAVRTKASAPYSGFHVGAALLAEDGSIVTEIRTAGNLARIAVFKAVSEGVRKFRAVAVVTGADAPTPPCGACRQVLWDQCAEIEVLMATLSGKQERRTLSSLYLHPFEFGGPK